jgi:hypothetical protein
VRRAEEKGTRERSEGRRRRNRERNQEQNKRGGAAIVSE